MMISLYACSPPLQLHYKRTDGTLVFKEYNIRFNELSHQKWRDDLFDKSKEDPKISRFNIALIRKAHVIYVFEQLPNRKVNAIDYAIFVKAERLDKGLTVTYEESLNHWLLESANVWRRIDNSRPYQSARTKRKSEALDKKWLAENVKKTAGKTVIDGEESYWAVITAVCCGLEYNYKIYQVYHHGFIYTFLLRPSIINCGWLLSTPFDKVRKEFDEWIRTVKFTKESSHENRSKKSTSGSTSVCQRRLDHQRG